MKIIRAKQAKVHSAYFVQRDNREIITKDFTKGKVPLRCDVLFAQPSYYLRNFPKRGFRVVALQTASKKCTKMPTAREARLVRFHSTK